MPTLTPPDAARLGAEWLVTLLRDSEKKQADSASQPREMAPMPGPALALNSVWVMLMAQVARGLAPAEQKTDTGGAEGVSTELLTLLSVKEQSVMVRVPEKPWEASMHEAA